MAVGNCKSGRWNCESWTACFTLQVSSLRCYESYSTDTVSGHGHWRPEFELEVVAVYTVDADDWMSMLIFSPTVWPTMTLGDGMITSSRTASLRVGLSWSDCNRAEYFLFCWLEESAWYDVRLAPHIWPLICIISLSEMSAWVRMFTEICHFRNVFHHIAQHFSPIGLKVCHVKSRSFIVRRDRWKCGLLKGFFLTDTF